ncbi:MAG: methyl-accepting chemotaxis protein, partial [Pseudomonas sp.]
MKSGTSGGFANLGMARKLGLGFTLVLVLTAAVAAIGVAALYSVGQRFEALKQMTAFNDGLLKVRLHEQVFALRSDPKAVEALHQGVAALSSQVEAAPALASSDVGAAL